MKLQDATILDLYAPGINQGKKLERRMTGTRIPVILFLRASAFTGTNWWDWSGR